MGDWFPVLALAACPLGLLAVSSIQDRARRFGYRLALDHVEQLTGREGRSLPDAVATLREESARW